jgi:UDP-N-acetylglucosamine:LPS N-acetylglucosamine transferase
MGTTKDLKTKINGITFHHHLYAKVLMARLKILPMLFQEIQLTAGKVNSVQEACAKCFAVHISKFASYTNSNTVVIYPS